jgi:hypothetical protein
MSEPGYWPNEQSGILAPVVEAYLNGRELDERGIAITRSYLRQWISAPDWCGGGDIEKLVAGAEQIRTQRDIDAWLEAAYGIGVDPL